MVITDGEVGGGSGGDGCPEGLSDQDDARGWDAEREDVVHEGDAVSDEAGFVGRAGAEAEAAVVEGEEVDVTA